MSNGKYLKDGDLIRLCAEDGNVKEFIIKSESNRDKRGGSVVCYEAKHELSGWGILKEFCPLNVPEVNANHFARSKQGQLYFKSSSSNEIKAFAEAKENYLKPYKMLLNAAQEIGGEELSTFLPYFEIYHSSPSDIDGEETVYIWTPAPAYEPFSELCNEIHKHPEVDSEYKLVTVLYAIYYLSQCVRIMHKHCLLHRDITPDNFGFVKRDGLPLPQSISFFDVNTVCWQFSKDYPHVGTPHYSEPNAPSVPDTMTDIYSIGTTLFNAIIVSDEAKANEYHFDYRRDYGRLRELVDTSELIMASEANSHSRVRDMITRVLQKTLGNRTTDKRYSRCEYICEDIEDILKNILPPEVYSGKFGMERIPQIKVRDKLDRHTDKSTTTAIQYHLYNHPLYEAILWDDKDAKKDINVLLIGFGKYGQKFLDACLQAGQIIDKTLNVTVVSRGVAENTTKQNKNKSDREIYLQSRPELAEFFNIDGSLEEQDKDSYGNVHFELRELNADDLSGSISRAEEVMFDHFENKRPDYIFIALGNDLLNRKVALAYRDFVKHFSDNSEDADNWDCSINYVCEQEPPQSKSSEIGMNRLYVYEEVSFPDIERMAFNTHLVWEKSLNIDYSKVKSNFKKPYNHDSCVSSVLALKYKLYSMNINLEEVGGEAAAKAYIQKLDDDMANKLVWIEHRRWVTEKLCLGWRRLSNLSECLEIGNTKDESSKRHVCIVRSKPNCNLKTKFGDLKEWDKSDLDGLDELDRMSVELHRTFSGAVGGNGKSKKYLTSGNIQEIMEAIEGNRKAQIAFSEWHSCIKDIIKREKNSVKLYDGLKQAFLETVNGELAKKISAQIAAFDRIFYPVKAAGEYRDWKQQDADFIDNIPFILTYDENLCIAVPYATGNNSEVFENVASATLINPKRILYLYLAENIHDVVQLEKSLPCVMEYMNRKKLRASVDFLIGYSAVLEKRIQKLKLCGGDKLKKLKKCKLNDVFEFSKVTVKYLQSKKAVSLERNSTKASYMLLGAGVYNQFPCYRFSANSIRFINMSGCDKFEYIYKKPHITVSEMAAFRLSSSEIGVQPEFFDNYKELWEKYAMNKRDKNSANNWKTLCRKLSEIVHKGDVLATFDVGDRNRAAERGVINHTYYLSPEYRNGAEKMVQLLKENNLIEDDSCVFGDSLDLCHVEINERLGGSNFDNLFMDFSKLIAPSALTAIPKTKSREVAIVYDGLEVKGLDLNSFSENKRPFIKMLLDFFKEKKYIVINAEHDGILDFSFATRQLKELLTVEGKMLEVYIYHKLKASGKFDDIISGFEIDWEGTGIKNEFDCIVSKGFRTLFIECKARSDIEQEFYFKLASLTKQFGINSKAVLIADTNEKSSYDNAAVNAMQRKRGNMMDVITIWKPDEINKIDDTLLKVINGNYVNKEE